MENEKIILVDKDNNKKGVEEKLIVHKKGLLHRAFSILIFNSKGELLIQQRIKTKYHSGGLWSNSVCGHPRPNESIEDAAHRRLREEAGFDCGLKELFCFYYRKKFNNNLIENELDHVFVGKYDGELKINIKEISAYKWVYIENLKKDIQKNPKQYTYWFKIILKKLEGIKI